MAKQDSVLPRLNHNAQQNYLFNVGLEIHLFNFYEITNAITNMPKVFSIQIWSYIPWKMLSLEKRLCKTLVVEVAMFLFPSPGDLPNPGMKPRSPGLQADSLPAEPQGKPKNTGVGNLSLLQRIFQTQESNWGLLHCQQILYQLSYQGSPKVRLLLLLSHFSRVRLCVTP